MDDRGADYPVTVDPIAQEAYLKASNTDRGDTFGWSVAVSGDTVVVGAPQEYSNGTGVNPSSQTDNSADASGAAYVFSGHGPGNGGPGDVNSDGVVDCLDLQAVQASFGRRAGEPGFSRNADVTGDGVVDVRDLATIARALPSGARCE